MLDVARDIKLFKIETLLLVQDFYRHPSFKEKPPMVMWLMSDDINVFMRQITISGFS